MRWQITPASIERRNEIISCIATPPLRRRIGCDNKRSISYFWWGSMVISIFFMQKIRKQFFHLLKSKPNIFTPPKFKKVLKIMETKSELKIVPKNSFSFFMEKEEKEKFKSE